MVSGADMTVEAALTKLLYLLGRPDLDIDAVREVCAHIHHKLLLNMGCDVSSFSVWGRTCVER